MKIGAVILAGGKSSRMGTDKAGLKIGGVSFLEKIAAELSDFDELLISVDSEDKYIDLPYPKVPDQYKDCGPMGGMASALSVCRSRALLVLACDSPLFTKELAQSLCSKMDEDTDAVVPVTDGRIHPLCGIYHKRCGDVFASFLSHGDYKIKNALKQMKTSYIDYSNSEFSEIFSTNINTPREYEQMCSKNSGI